MQEYRLKPFIAALEKFEGACLIADIRVPSAFVESCFDKVTTPNFNALDDGQEQVEAKKGCVVTVKAATGGMYEVVNISICGKQQPFKKFSVTKQMLDVLFSSV